MIHVDLDGMSEIARVHGWAHADDERDPIFESGLSSLLDLFEQSGVRATLFVVAGNLENGAKRELLQEAVRRGHEIASHTLTHPSLSRMHANARRRELAESRDRLEAGLGVPVRGFRAPNYEIDRECIRLLADCGYAWDSSALPTAGFARRLDVPVEALTRPGRPFDECDLIELPLPNHRPSPVPINPSYALVLGEPYFRWGLRRVRATGRPFVLLMHLIDVARPMPPGRIRGLRGRLYTLSYLSEEHKRERCRRMLGLVQTHYRVTSTDSLLAELARGASA